MKTLITVAFSTFLLVTTAHAQSVLTSIPGFGSIVPRTTAPAPTVSRTPVDVQAARDAYLARMAARPGISEPKVEWALKQVLAECLAYEHRNRAKKYLVMILRRSYPRLNLGGRSRVSSRFIYRPWRVTDAICAKLVAENVQALRNRNARDSVLKSEYSRILRALKNFLIPGRRP